MKPETRRVASQIGRSHRGIAWHGPSVMEALDGVDAALALRRASPEVHSIWELVKHVTAWQRVTLDTLRGEPYVSMTGDADWPPVTGATDADWQADVTAMATINAELVAAVREFPEERLEEIVAGTQFNYYFLLCK